MAPSNVENTRDAIKQAGTMAIEIERKFLVVSDAWRPLVKTRRHIRQAYLSNSQSNTTRIRIIDDTKALLTIKSAYRGLTREEFEYEVPVTDALEMLHLRHSGIIDKVRNAIPFEGFTWELDVFAGDNEGLIIAEVELSDETQNPKRPDWIGQEVTGDLRYQNSQLAAVPYSTWDWGNT